VEEAVNEEPAEIEQVVDVACGRLATRNHLCESLRLEPGEEREEAAEG
jgi:hypothetical protein